MGAFVVFQDDLMSMSSKDTDTEVFQISDFSEPGKVRLLSQLDGFDASRSDSCQLARVHGSYTTQCGNPRQDIAATTFPFSGTIVFATTMGWTC